MPSRLAQLPAIHRLLADPALVAAGHRHGRELVRDAARSVVAATRARLAAGEPVPATSGLVVQVIDLLAQRTCPAYPRVINATGVLIHTNLGRAPVPSAPADAYLALEYDLASGERGERLGPVVERLKRYFGAEAATVVTNNAAAIVLLLAAHAAGRQVVVSRGELVEIGGSFRLPEIMAAAGATLVEVGCTNRTRADDYAAAIGPDTAALLVVHRSNFALSGFVSSPSLDELVALGRRHGVPVWVDQGSGCHLDLGAYGLRHEATVREILSSGAEVVLFSGDKLLGGPQSGILVGHSKAVAALRQHPLRRALRPDKSVLATLASTLDAFLAGRPDAVPLYRLLGTPERELGRRARRLVNSLRRREVPAEAARTDAVVGGGTTPDQTLPSWAVCLEGGRVLASALRNGQPPVVGRIEQDLVVLDLRAVFPAQDRELEGAVVAAWAGH